MSKKSTKLAVEKSSQPQPTAAAPTSSCWEPFETPRRQVDHLFENFAPSQWQRPWITAPQLFGHAAGWPVAPAIDLTEQNGTFHITAELPGIDPSDIEVRVSDGMLTIRGEKKEETDKEEADYHLCERRYGTFQHSFSLPDSVDADMIEASFANGVLTLTLPKSEAAKASEKTIEIKAA